MAPNPNFGLMVYTFDQKRQRVHKMLELVAETPLSQRSKALRFMTHAVVCRQGMKTTEQVAILVDMPGSRNTIALTTSSEICITAVEDADSLDTSPDEIEQFVDKATDQDLDRMHRKLPQLLSREQKHELKKHKLT